MARPGEAGLGAAGTEDTQDKTNSEVIDMSVARRRIGRARDNSAMDWLADIRPELHELARSLPPLMNSADAAHACACSERTICERVQRGELAAVRAGKGSRVLVPRSVIINWLNARLVERP